MLINTKNPETGSISGISYIKMTRLADLHKKEPINRHYDGALEIMFSDLLSSKRTWGIFYSTGDGTQALFRSMSREGLGTVGVFKA